MRSGWRRPRGKSGCFGSNTAVTQGWGYIFVVSFPGQCLRFEEMMYLLTFMHVPLELEGCFLTRHDCSVPCPGTIARSSPLLPCWSAFTLVMLIPCQSSAAYVNSPLQQVAICTSLVSELRWQKKKPAAPFVYVCCRSISHLCTGFIHAVFNFRN